MGFIKRKNKKFDYQPRYYKGDGNPYEFKHRFDDHRPSVGKNNGIKNKLNNALDEFKNSENGGLNTTILTIIVFLTLIFLFIIDFDLSIFLSKN